MVVKVVINYNSLNRKWHATLRFKDGSWASVFPSFPTKRKCLTWVHKMHMEATQNIEVYEAPKCSSR